MNDARASDTAARPWAVTETMPYAASVPAKAPSPPAAATAPAVTPPTWTGRKTAVAAALAIGISSLGAPGGQGGPGPALVLDMTRAP